MCHYGLGFLLAAMLGITAGDVGAGEAPRRIASLNLCADQLLLALVERERIVSLSYLAADDRFSLVADRVGDIPLNGGGPEQVLALQPDLILVGAYNDPVMRQSVQRLGYRVEALAQPSDLAGVLDQVAYLGDLLAVPQKARALIQSMRERLQRLRRQAAGQTRLRVINYGPNGMVAGDHTLMHSVISAAGGRNLAAEAGIVGYGYLPLERLLAQRPDKILIERDPQRSASLAQRYLQHPVLGRAFSAADRIAFPSTWVSCPGPQLLDAVAALVNAR